MIATEDTLIVDAIRTGRHHRDVELMVEHSGEGRVWVRANIGRINDSANRVAGAVVCFHDIVSPMQTPANSDEAKPGASELNARVHVAYRPAGVECDIDAPLH